MNLFIPIAFNSPEFGGLGGIIVLIGIVIFAVLWSTAAARKRRDDLTALAHRLGLQFSEARDEGMATRLGYLNQLGQGHNPYAYNVISGTYKNHSVFYFDFHYETYSVNAKGQPRTEHHYISCVLLMLPASFPELIISREGLFSKIAQMIGYDDIDFESYEFSKTFCVRSSDKKFAYDICHTRAMEYLLAHRDVNIEIENHTLALLFDRVLTIDEVERNLNRIIEFYSLWPEYLLEGKP